MPDINSATLVRRLTSRYILALLLLAGISVTSHLVQLRELQSNTGDAGVINLSGRQRMLSQRIAAMAVLYRLGDSTAKAELLRIIPQMASAEAALSAPYRDSSPNPQLYDLYFAGPQALDPEIQRFLHTAQQVTELNPNDPALQSLLDLLVQEARAPLLDRLHQVVTLYQTKTETKLGKLARLQWMLLTVILITLVAEALLIFRPMVQSVSAYSRDLIALTNTDQLTGIANRRGFHLRARTECIRSHRYSRPLSLLAIDIDLFKRVNDNYGHAAGDAILRALGPCMTATLRPVDLLARLGGEEFAVLLPETALPGALAAAERVRAAVAALNVMHEDTDLWVTVSIGAATLPSDATSIDATLEHADQMLYQAKQAGRNRVAGATLYEQLARREALRS